ncbi:hypothetical protein UFOVP380_49 [uncultured Caudovirales phage]|uniref:Uncharacterized protein n=1 Tax=uncultured Caudovirales phage TaxID=2100421 RepID=A0A6J7X2N6_9CAUD|nr:hypothetical protein UFOVP380_49 [uncultured Caudovirales phage]
MNAELAEEYLRLVSEENEHVYNLEWLLEEIEDLEDKLSAAKDSMVEWTYLEDGDTGDTVAQRRSRIEQLRQALVQEGTPPVHTPALINPDLLENARQIF